MTTIEALVSLRPDVSWSVIGDTYEGIEPKDERPTEEEIEREKASLKSQEPMKKLREERNKMLTSTDYLFVLDYPFKDDEERQAWVEYRQALRDLPLTAKPELGEMGELIGDVFPQAP